jgi:iron complex transport system substrate-binding protein
MVRIQRVRIAIALMAALAIACSVERGRTNAPDGGVIVDDFGDTLSTAAPPKRIVSLYPASTELLFSLGAGDRLVGRTRWDIWPDQAVKVRDVGDGIRPNLESVLSVRPDFVVLYASAENRDAASRLRAAGVRTLSLKVDMPRHFDRMTRILGRVLGDTITAGRVADSVQQSLARTRALTSTAEPERAVWIVELDPLMVIGGGSFLSEIIETAGATNVFASISGPSAVVSMETLVTLDPAVILGSAAVVEQVRRGAIWRGITAVKENRVLAADSYTMGRPSVRMGEAARNLAMLLHPELFR